MGILSRHSDAYEPDFDVADGRPDPRELAEDQADFDKRWGR